MKTALIIGGGFAGCSAAHALALQGGWDVTLVEAAPFLGGGCKTLWHGGHPYTFGPRHFLTKNEKTFNYLNEYCPLRRCPEHVFLTHIEEDAQFYNYPIHIDDVDRMPECDQIKKELKEAKILQGSVEAKNFEEFWISSIGQTLYDKFINKYSKKMWQVEDNKVIDDFTWSPKGVTLMEGPRAAWTEAISAFPHAANGYDDYFDIATTKARVLLKTKIESFDIPEKTVVWDGEKHQFDVIVNTIPPDTVMNFSHGELPFVGREFHKFVLPIAHAFPKDVYFLYYAGNESYTRLVEYKQFTRQNYDSPSTIIGMEIPKLNAGRFYPMPIKSEYACAQKYFDDMPDELFSIGRAGSYEYRVAIDDCIDQAMKVAEDLGQ